ncbi:MAG: sigma-70 family RNA polymerase sigma factor [Oscillospiraceae bacterium]|nr:sigma-70 family RNA polymerase sigma factor [Oscillospiraceae bacterium]
MDNEQLTLYIRKYGDTVYRVSYNFVKTPADSEDIVQEVFLKLYRTDKKFESEEHVKAWLIRVAANLAKNHVKAPAQSRRTELDENIPSSDNEDRELHAAMQSLPEKYGIVIYLHYFEGYGTREIASMLKITDSNVKARLKRGREKLKAYLTDQ